MMKTRILLPVLSAVVIGGSLLGVSVVHAQDTAGSSQSIVQRIATKFGVNAADVQSVFDEEHQARQAAMKASQDERLTQAVTDGKITEEQKQAIVTKRSDMVANRPTDPTAFKNMTDDQRKAEREKNKAEMDAWALANGLTEETVRELMGPGRGHGGNMFFMKHESM